MDTTNIQPENNVAPANGEVGKLFRNALGGFNKQDVTDYIERMARDRRRDAERYSAHIRSLEEERAASAQEISRLRAQTAELTSESYAARHAKEETEREMLVLREANEKLEQDAAELQARLAEREETPSPADGLMEALEAARREAAEKDQEVCRLSAAMEALEIEKSRMERELEMLRRRPAVSGQAAAQSSGAELMNRVRTKPSVSAHEVAEMRSRIERARQCAREGISECNSLYQEMRRNIERLEEILRDLND